MTSCWGRGCKIGWGYNQSSDQLIPVDGKSPNYTFEARNEWWYSFPFNLSSTDIQCEKSISLLLEPRYRKLLDFKIVLDDDQYYMVHGQLSGLMERSKKFPQYPPNCSHFVSILRYGVDLWVQFPKIGFPRNAGEIYSLFKNRSFDETQKKIKCRVLINHKEIREMTIGELDQAHSRQLDIPVEFWCDKLTQEVQETAISNESAFTKSLSYLYCVYRKIEIKMEKAGYPDILPDLDSKEVSLDNIRANLSKAKEEYKLMQKNDFLKMYPILKKLFFSYIDYIRYSIENAVDMDEGKSLPGTVDEIKPWLQQLNNWLPEKTNITAKIGRSE